MASHKQKISPLLMVVPNYFVFFFKKNKIQQNSSLPFHAPNTAETSISLAYGGIYLIKPVH